MFVLRCFICLSYFIHFILQKPILKRKTETFLDTMKFHSSLYFLGEFINKWVYNGDWNSFTESIMS